jgi:hypothetical protein
MNYLGVHGVMNGHLLLSGHHEPIPTAGVLGIGDVGRRVLEAAREATPVVDKVEHGERPRAADGEPLDRFAVRSVVRSVNPSAS